MEIRMKKVQGRIIIEVKEEDVEYEINLEERLDSQGYLHISADSIDTCGFPHPTDAKNEIIQELIKHNIKVDNYSY